MKVPGRGCFDFHPFVFEYSNKENKHSEKRGREFMLIC